METQKPSISPLRQRMIDDMRMRKFGEKTQLDYIRAVRWSRRCSRCICRASCR